jgi:hypothetical protein
MARQQTSKDTTNLCGSGENHRRRWQRSQVPCCNRIQKEAGEKFLARLHSEAIKGFEACEAAAARYPLWSLLLSLSLSLSLSLQQQQHRDRCIGSWL